MPIYASVYNAIGDATAEILENHDIDVDALNTAIATANNRINTNESAINTNSTIAAQLQQDLVDLEAVVVSNGTDIVAINSAVAAVEASLAQFNTDVSDLQADVAANVTDISTNAAAISTVAGDVALVEATVAGLNADVSAVTGDIAANTAAIATNSTDIATNAAAIAANASEIATATQNVTDLETAVAVNAADITNVETDVTALTNRVTTAEANIVSNDTDIANNTAAIAANATAITNVQTTVNTATATIASNTSAIAGLDTRVTAAEGDIVTNAGAITTLTGTVSGFSADIAQNTSDIAANAVDIAQNATDIANVNTAISGVTGDIVTLQADVASNGAQIGLNTLAIDTNATNIDTLTTRMDSVEGVSTQAQIDIAANTAAIATNASDITAVDGRVDALLAGTTTDFDTFVEVVNAFQTADSTINGAITTLAADSVAADAVLQGQIDTISTNLTTLDGEFTTLQGTVAQNTADIAAIVHYTDADVDAYLQSGSVTSINIDNNTTIDWNAVDGTVNVNYNNGVSLQVGQEQHIYVKAVGAIANGDIVMFAGAEGNHILATVANPAAPGFKPEHIIGVATQVFANNDFGYVTTFGKVNDLDTSSYTEGDIIYMDTDGSWTTVVPTAPNHVVQVAAVTYSHAIHGSILVRPNHLVDTDEVNEGSVNLYYTDARVQSVIDAGNYATITYVDAADAVLQGNIDVNSAAIATNTSDIATNAGNIATNTTDIATNAAAIAQNTTDINTNSAAISGNSADIVQIQSDLAAIDVSGLQAQADANTADIATINTNLTTLDGDLTTLQGDVTTNTNAIAANVSSITGVSNTVSSLSTTVGTNTSDISALDTRVTANEGDIATNVAGILALDSSVTTNTSDIATNTAAISTNTTAISGLDTRVTALEGAPAGGMNLDVGFVGLFNQAPTEGTWLALDGSSYDSTVYPNLSGTPGYPEAAAGYGAVTATALATDVGNTSYNDTQIVMSYNGTGAVVREGDNSSMYYTNDSGATWTNSGLNMTFALSAGSAASSEIVVFGRTTSEGVRLFDTATGTVTDGPYTTPAAITYSSPEPTYGNFSSCTDGAGTFYVAINDASSTTIMYNTVPYDLSTFVTMTAPAAPQSIEFFEGKLFITTRASASKIYTTVDNGSNWVDETPYAVAYAEFMLNASPSVLVATELDTGIYSVYSGGTWTSTANTQPDGNTNSTGWIYVQGTPNTFVRGRQYIQDAVAWSHDGMANVSVDEAFTIAGFSSAVMFTGTTVAVLDSHAYDGNEMMTEITFASGGTSFTVPSVSAPIPSYDYYVLAD